ncbi:MAG TPA: site-2 protease family protein [Solirubrobacteraceae bacterium]|jgi:Zn-dependent protease|nr:site-2 protease family protein [Solirubrobacteraceae bacterium]
MWRRSSSIKLMDLFGFRIGVDRSWFLILFLVIFLLSGEFRQALHSSDAVAYLTTVVTVLVLFGSLIVHELGHALVARREGITVRRIDLFLFGGLTEMSRDAATPAEDFKIAAAGPLATFGFVLLCLAVDLAIVGPHRLVHAAELDNTVQITPVLLSLSWLLFWNILLLFFNLVPAFPLDGGRMTRAVIWRVTGQKERGTRTAAKLGQGFSLVLAGIGVFVTLDYRNLSGLWLIGIAFLMYQSAKAALVQTAISARIEGVRVADIMDRQPVAIPSRTAVTQALDEFFLRYGWSWFPVIDDDYRFLGIARQERLAAAQDRGEDWLTVDAVLEPEQDGGWRVNEDRPITEVISSENLGRLGALMAVDGDGVLRGVVTVEQVRRALQAAFGSPGRLA